MQEWEYKGCPRHEGESIKQYMEAEWSTQALHRKHLQAQKEAAGLTRTATRTTTTRTKEVQSRPQRSGGGGGGGGGDDHPDSGDDSLPEQSLSATVIATETEIVIGIGTETATVTGTATEIEIATEIETATGRRTLQGPSVVMTHQKVEAMAQMVQKSQMMAQASTRPLRAEIVDLIGVGVVALHQVHPSLTSSGRIH